jgi:hypothetical protein
MSIMALHRIAAHLRFGIKLKVDGGGGSRCAGMLDKMML